MAWLVLAAAATSASCAWLVVSCRSQPLSRLRAFVRLMPPALTFVIAGSALEAAGSRYGGSIGGLAAGAATVTMAAMFVYSIWKVSRVRRSMEQSA